MIPPLLSRWIQQRRYHAALPYISGAVLDVGCGHAYLAALLPPSHSYVGVDREPAFLRAAQARTPRAEFYQVDLESGTIPPEVSTRRFDTIVMTAVLEHLARPARALQQLVPLLAPGGRIVATTPTPFGHRVHRIGARLGLFYREAADDHKSILDASTLGSLFHAAGLHVVAYKQFELGCNQLIVGSTQP
ncbi:MAG TPA: class I SAM-dependent methyltransferase [Ardenticatenaceae bacterium]|nr:class I SAM-dependent methyltransferase [Ardenticatenaceae bacterium]